MPVSRPIVLLMTAAGLASPAALRAQTAPAEGFRLSGSLRMRYELIDGQARAGFNASDQLVNARAMVLAEYALPSVRFAAELYDSRAWGENERTPFTTGEVNTLELVQAYVAADVARPFGKGSTLSVTAGRFMLNLGSRRLVAADDYRNTTNGYTGARADLSAPAGLRATLVYVLPQTRLPDDPAGLRSGKVKVDAQSFDAVLWGGLASKGRALGPATAELSFYHFGERDAPGRPTRDRSLNTVGARLFAEPRAGKLDFELEAMHQSGTVSASAAAAAGTQKVSASFVHAALGYRFPGPAQARIAVEFDRASGDGTGGLYGRFDTLFGMRRADLAPSGLYNAVGRANIVSPGVRLEVAPDKRLDAFVTYRPMWLASATDGFSTTGVRDASGAAGDFAGHQVDARVRTWLLPGRLRVEIDGVLLAKGRFLRDAPKAPPGAVTRYASFNLTGFF